MFESTDCSIVGVQDGLLGCHIIKEEGREREKEREETAQPAQKTSKVSNALTSTHCPKQQFWTMSPALGAGAFEFVQNSRAGAYKANVLKIT